MRGRVRSAELARRTAAEESLANITFEHGDAQVHPLSSGREGAPARSP
ncbi:hypothetical protein ACQPZZ_16650 [Microbispora sp. CA-135349]